MATLAPLWVGAATGFLGWSTGYAMLAGLLVLAGTGRSVYHPQGAAGVARYAGDRRGLSMSLFTAAGNLGFAAGPLMATAAIALGGLRGTIYVIPLGFMVSGLIFSVVFRDTGFRSVSWRPPPLRRVIEDLAEQKHTIMRLWLVVVLRSLTYFSLFTFLPMLFTRQGLSTVRTGVMVSLFLFGGASGGLVGGWLSDRVGEKKVIVASLIAAFPALQLALILRGPEGVVLLGCTRPEIRDGFIGHGVLPDVGFGVGGRRIACDADRICCRSFGYGMGLAARGPFSRRSGRSGIGAPRTRFRNGREEQAGRRILTYRIGRSFEQP
jgi:FSR family fosmidomycin resistance protein-like MFS transporter